MKWRVLVLATIASIIILFPSCQMQEESNEIPKLNIEETIESLDVFNSENHPDGSLYTGSVRDVHLDSSNRLWVAGAYGLARYSHNGWTFFDSGHFPPDPYSSLWNAHTVIAVHENGIGEIYAGCTMGVLKLDPGSDQWVDLGVPFADASTGQDGTVINFETFGGFFTGNNGSLYCWTDLKIVRLIGSNWERIYGYQNISEGLIRGASIDSSGCLWASNRGTLLRIESPGEPEVIYTAPESTLYNFRFDSAKRILLMEFNWETAERKILRLGGDTMVEIAGQGEAPCERNPFGFSIDPRNRLWVYGEEGISYYDGSSWINFPSSEYQFPGIIAGLFFDSYGNFWGFSPDGPVFCRPLDSLVND